MAIEVISEFTATATVRTIAYIYDDDGNLVEPSSVSISIWDPDGGDPVVDSVNIVVTGRVEDGIYEHYYNTDADSEKGYWRGQIAVVDGTYTSIGNFGFRVK